MSQQIEYKYNSHISVFFIPLENGRCEYNVEVHDFSNLDCVKEILTYCELERLLKDPVTFTANYRKWHG